MNYNTMKAQQEEKSTLIIFLLFIFFGYFAVHRFYANGFTLFNVLYACTGGFLLVMIFVDFFLIWGMAKKANAANLLDAQMKDMMLNGSNTLNVKII